jgi:hypothetical protein
VPLTNLSLVERANLLWSEGKFLNTVTYNKCKVSLYEMDGKYYEMWYDVAGDLIEKIIPMENPELFSDYL